MSQKCADTIPEQEHAKSSPRVQRSAQHISHTITAELRPVQDDPVVRVWNREDTSGESGEQLLMRRGQRSRQ